MTFDLKKSLEILSRTPAVLEALLSDISETWLINNEGPGTWSPYDIVGHLIHGERTDWLVRTKIILSDLKDKTFEPFDRFAQLKSGNVKSMEALLIEFRKLRKENIAELKSLQIEDSDLSAKGMHPELGEVDLRQLLSSWVVHDLGHLSQISRVMAKQYSTDVGPWKAYMGILKR